MVARCQDHIQLIFLSGVNEVLFFQERDGPFFPTLRLLHKYPDMMVRVQVDIGAIKFVMQGANVMCPGLTSATGIIPDTLEVGMPVAIYAHGKENAMGMGVVKMTSQQM